MVVSYQKLTVMHLRLITLTCLVTASCCNNETTSQHANNHFHITLGNTVLLRFNPPNGYKRKAVDSFGSYLRYLPLQPAGALVHLYNGAEKSTQKVHAAVIKMDVGIKDLQQCADAIMRLRAEYLYHAGKYNAIHFNFTNGFRADYYKWLEGYRIKVKDNDVSWVKTHGRNVDYAVFRQYMDMVFSYAGTLSLSRELEAIPLDNMRPGDVLIQGGSPGHAVMVMDVAENLKGEKYLCWPKAICPHRKYISCTTLKTGQFLPGMI